MIDVGSKVSWTRGTGWNTGIVAAVYLESGSIFLDEVEVTHKASRENPAYLIAADGELIVLPKSKVRPETETLLDKSKQRNKTGVSP